MNAPSPYQEDLFCELAGLQSVVLEVIYHSGVPKERRRLGWSVRTRGYEHSFLKTPKLLHAVKILKQRRESVHVINGIWAVPVFTAALMIIGLLLATPCFIYSEASDRPAGRNMALCWLKKRLGNWLAAKRNVKALAVSTLAVAHFRNLGFPEERIYEFGYFRQANIQCRPGNAVGGNHLVYVGQLVHRKGLDLLLAALEPVWIQYADLRLDLIGQGKQFTCLEEYCKNHPSARVRLRGAISSDQIAQELAAYSLLVLPSRFDGWGIVVNEALAAGVPVLVSDNCGVADLIEHGCNGYKFQSESVRSLREMLIHFLETDAGRRNRLHSAALKTGDTIKPALAAQYLHDCILHAIHNVGERPTPLWKGNK